MYELNIFNVYTYNLFTYDEISNKMHFTKNGHKNFNRLYRSISESNNTEKTHDRIQYEKTTLTWIL